MATALQLLWLAICLVVIDANDPLSDSEYGTIVKAVKRDLEEFLERNGLESTPPLRADDENSSEESNMIEQETKFMDGFTDPSTPVMEDLYATEYSVPSEQEYKETLGSSQYADSIKGMPGVHFPDYTDIPLTSFTCDDKPHIPGFYADLDTGCQVFHACLNDRLETFLCPIGTIFNQVALACDNWYNSVCSLAPFFYNVNEGNKYNVAEVQEKDNLLSALDAFLPSKTNKSSKGDIPLSVSSFVTNFMPVKTRVTLYSESEGQRSKIQSVDTTENNVLFRHFAYNLNEKLDQILEDFKNAGSIRDYSLVEVVVKNLRKLLKEADPEFDQLLSAKLNDIDADRMERLMNYISQMANKLFKDSVFLYDLIIGSDSGSTTAPVIEGGKRISHEEKSRRVRDVSSIGQSSSKYFQTRPEFGNADSILHEKFKRIVEHLTPVLISTYENEKPKNESFAKPTLNPRFITKPVTQEKVITLTSEQSRSNLSKSFVEVESSKSRKVKSSTSTKRVTISEKTKKALLFNYIRLIKIKAKKSHENA